MLFQALLAFVTLENNTVTTTEIEQDLKRFLPSYMMPQIQIIQEIPLLFNGKVNREFWKKAYEESRQRQGILCPRFGAELIGRISWLPTVPLGPIFMTVLPER